MEPFFIARNKNSAIVGFMADTETTISRLYIYLVKPNRSVGRTFGYGHAIIVAPDEDTARGIHPSGELRSEACQLFDWAEPQNLTVRRLGVADPDFKSGDVVATYWWE